MVEHKMVPATRPGFKTECEHCGALDTEIRFEKSNICPVLAEKYLDQTPVIQIMIPTQEQQTILMQAAWFDGYAHRQMMRTVK